MPRQKAFEYSRQSFKGLFYQIEDYKLYENGMVITRQVGILEILGHIHRHLWTAELINKYGFDGIDLSIYGGWTLKNTSGLSVSIERYAHVNWRR